MNLLLLAFYLCTCNIAVCFVYALDITGDCQKECNTNLYESTSTGDVNCNDTCRVTQCSVGCEIWKEAASSSCDDVCNQTFERQVTHTKYLHCNIGCHYAGSLYIQSVKDELGATPPPPVLVADTQTNVSVGVRWKGPTVPLVLNISYLIQWKYESVLGATWEYYRPKAPITDTASQIVEGLQPYTKYKFRVAWIILSKHDLIFSKESVCISTLPYGPPSTAPVITAVSNVDATRVSVTWDPPRFPNGPILSYVVHLYQHAKGVTLIKDIPGPNPDNFFIFSNLQSNTTYTVAVACRNSVGEGPRVTHNITTLSGPLVAVNTGAFLIIASARNVVKVDLQNMMDVVLYAPVNSSVQITGMASHLRANLFFVSDSLGDIHRVPIIDFVSNNTVVTPSELHDQVTRLSVDWLNNKLYLVEKRQISRCDFDGNNYEVVITGLSRIESDLKVDPYYGYLYWVAAGPSSGGLYRIDLEELGTSVLVQNDSLLLVQDSHLSTIAIDHQNFCIFLTNNTENTVYAVSLSGSELVDVRHNTQQPKFQGTKAMSIYKDLLYWATPDQVYEEEHLEDRYYHNSILVTNVDSPFVALDIVHPEAQPVPVPVNPVCNVQALFHDVQVRVTWLPPKPLGGLGRGAWQHWHYEISINDSQHDGTISRTNITSISYTITGLEQNTSYSVKVRAYSQSGTGPWSQMFTGTTLKSATEKGYPHILWSSKGLLKSDMVGNDVQPVISWSNLENSQVIDISWYNDLLFINTNNSKVFMYNTSDHLSLNLMNNITSAISVAVDWLGRKIYWSNAKQQMISRANLDGSQVEPLPILTIAKELNIDSISGHIYWTTSHSVECARLNGEEPRKYFQTGFFSGRKVMGLTLDHDRKRVIWMVWSSEGATLYQASMASYYPVTREKLVNSIVTEYMEPFAEDALQGSIHYFSDHLYWLRNPNEAVISDLSGENAAHLFNSGLVDLRSLAIIDPTLQPYPDKLTYETVQVIPNAVNSMAVTVNGIWKDFNISWPKVSNVNHGQVFYEIGIDDEADDYGSGIVVVSEYPYYVYPHLRLLPPYSKLTVSVRAYSYWGSSPRMVTTVYSPMSVPSEPLHPRVFVTSNKTGSLEVEFRWAAPKRPNGIILGYIVTVWNSDTYDRRSLDPIWEENIYGQNKLVYVSKHLNRNVIYVFQVRAYTKVGEGPQSESIEARTDVENPVPKLLVGKENVISLFDMDNHDEVAVSIGAVNPSDVVYLWVDGTVFWLDQNTNALLRSNVDGTDRVKLHSLTFTGASLSVDWVGRRLYWSEVDEINRNSSVWSLEVDRKDDPKVLLTTGTRIGAIAVDPFTSTLLWTSIAWNGVGTMMKCKADGSQPHSLFSTSKSNHRIQRDAHPEKHESEHKTKKSKTVSSCNCSSNVAVASAMTIDTNGDYDGKRLVFVDSQHGLLWASDLEGCDCQLLLNGSNHGFPPTSIAVDSNRFFWSNAVTKQIYSIKKSSPNENNTITVSDVPGGVRSIEAFGSHLQPYPDTQCLTPQPYDKTPLIANVTATTVTLLLDAFSRNSQSCDNVSMASVRYTIYYVALNDTDSMDPCDTNTTSCLTLDTYTPTNTVSSLEPYTVYSFRVAVSNHYTETRPKLGPATTQRTAESVPPSPTNVVVTVLSPEAVDVSWDFPMDVSGPMIKYTVYWRLQQYSTNTVSVTSSSNHFNNGSDITNRLHHPVMGLDQSQEYAFWVQAVASSGVGFNNSKEVIVQLFTVPDALQCNNVTSTSMALSWKSSDTSLITRLALRYKMISEVTEFNATDFEVITPGHNYTFMVQNLVPKSRYKFWLLTIYNSSGFVYQWPKGDKFTYETLGDFPGPPGVPDVLAIQRDTFKVLWTPSDARGGVQLAYILEAKLFDQNAESDFVVVYNGSDTKWTPVGLDMNAHYTFRVCAYNEYGVGNFSENSPRSSFLQSSDENEASDEQLEIVLGATVPILFLLLVSISYILFKVHRKREKEKKILQEIVHNSHNPDLELATLRDLPQNQNFIHENNALYALSDIPSDAELAALPHVSSNQIVLIKFLGCGAFGEVFEGIARTLPGESETDIRVAIKTLRKGATDHEKTEFLKEAQLMSNFKHEHILSLLGVCLDNDPNFLILELMEGGDLLSYLRNNRPTAFSTSPLSSHDLISICVDVAHGCCHLEDMHFIHRDLAARNCLVSSHDSLQRTVKIGDFGLARDIYKNDYYRKEGEGLLPVRWMSPESLVDGVFTSQSDVWAFGVLLWEVMTLGQQPYPARTNVEVLHYVRGGGRLDKPDNCPDDLHQLMLKCWSYNPSERPTFRYCLDKLQELRRRSSQTPTTNNNNSVHNQNYLGRQEAAGGVDNLAYTSDENVRCQTGDVPSRGSSSMPRTRVSEAETASVCSTTSDIRNESRRLTSETDNDDDTMELLEKQQQNCGSHRYLELLYDNDLSPGYDGDGGYEVPLSSSIHRKGPFALEWAFVKDDKSSPHSTYGRSDIRTRTMSDSSVLSSNGSIPPIFTDGVPRVSDGDDSSLTSHVTDGDVKETDDAKQLAATYGRVVHRSQQRGASQPLLLFHVGETDELSEARCKNRGSVVSVGDIEMSSTRKGIFMDGQLFSGNSIPLTDVSSEHHHSLGHHRQHKPWRESSVSLGTDASSSSNGIGVTDPSTDATSSHLSGISALSAFSSSSTSGIDMDYAPTSAWC